ncbi:hypothetical protein GALMADRAFT_225072 [Galerina marginata CBS 339.88]|uniref:Uncharacterized protein n=1 Tax=Galerina marginata (strain CBS 339.88) TaxID=685588 RepID=A0A067TAJ4_GALM3|nr:hypothetical protein GALMADRAFT_225072 [Galerina marginata CBS 339.88]
MASTGTTTRPPPDDPSPPIEPPAAGKAAELPKELGDDPNECGPSEDASPPLEPPAVAEFLASCTEVGDEQNDILRQNSGARGGHPVSHIHWEQEAAVMARVGVRFIQRDGAMSNIVYIGNFEPRPRNWTLNLNRFNVPFGSSVQILTDVQFMGIHTIHGMWHVYDPSLPANGRTAHYSLKGTAFRLWYEFRGYR